MPLDCLPGRTGEEVETTLLQNVLGHVMIIQPHPATSVAQSVRDLVEHFTHDRATVLGLHPAALWVKPSPPNAAGALIALVNEICSRRPCTQSVPCALCFAE
jgi:hypothetical protein